MPCACSTFKPRIYSRLDLRDLLEIAVTLNCCHLPLCVEAFRLLLLVLYRTALRPGEARHLRVCDGDLDTNGALSNQSLYRDRWEGYGNATLYAAIPVPTPSPRPW